jgi:hypothetical protein
VAPVRLSGRTRLHLGGQFGRQAPGHISRRQDSRFGRVQVDADGRELAVTAPNRPRLVGKSVVDTAWSGRVSEYQTFGRLRVPTVAEATWHLPEGPFTYWRGRVTDFKTLR